MKNTISDYLPDAFVFALILSFLTYFLGLANGAQAIDLLQAWQGGLWSLHTFAMQMVLILVLGIVIARTKIVYDLLQKLSSFAGNNVQAVGLVTIVSSVVCFLNWGLGLVVSALFALEVAKKVRRVNFALLLSSSYSGFLLWHGGPSGSIPLKLTAPDASMQKLLNVQNLSLNETLYSRLNLGMLLGTFVVVLLFNLWMARKEDHIEEFKWHKEQYTETHFKNDTWADRLQNSRLFMSIFAFACIMILIRHFVSGKGLDLNTVLFVLLAIALVFNCSANRFLHQFNNAVKDASGIILQFPFYGGIMAMMQFSGLAATLSKALLAFSTKQSFLVLTYLSAGLVNFFVPSGGGQWAIQGPIIIPAAQSLGVSVADAAMAIAWGDAWTNMIQPFWALPLLSIGHLKLADIMGHCLGVLLVSGLWGILYLSFVA